MCSSDLNNPDGNVFDKEFLLEIINRNKDVLFIIDQSYKDFTLKETLNFKNDFNNLIIINSATKIFNIPGLRLGYIFSSETIRLEIVKVRMPWSVNAFAVEAGKFFFKNSIDFNLPKLLMERDYLISKLKDTGIFSISDSDTHYFTAKLLKGKSYKLKNILANDYSLLIRDASNFGETMNNHIRLSTQNRQANDYLIRSINEILKENRL